MHIFWHVAEIVLVFNFVYMFEIIIVEIHSTIRNCNFIPLQFHSPGFGFNGEH
jgi:hypothetical protein